MAASGAAAAPMPTPPLAETLCSSTLAAVDARVKMPCAAVMTDGIAPNERFIAPARTTALCWHCVHGYDTPPVVLPMDVTHAGEQRVIGLFCSFSCAMGYAIDHALHANPEVVMRLNINAAQSGVSVPVRRAPPMRMLKMFGGTLDIDTFRARGSAGSVPVRVLLDTMVSFPVMLEGWRESSSSTSTIRAGDGVTAVERTTLSASTRFGTMTTQQNKQSESETRGLYHEYIKQQQNRGTSTGAAASADTSSPAPVPAAASADVAADDGAETMPMAVDASPRFQGKGKKRAAPVAATNTLQGYIRTS